MWIMNLVWPITCLYAGPFAAGFYWIWNRAPRSGERDGGSQAAKPLWRSALVGAAHCGAGCTLGDLAGDMAVSSLALRVFGSGLSAKLLLAFVFAYALGIFFQFFAIAPMRHLGFRAGLVAAIKADTASLIAFEVGMFAWMLISQTWLIPDVGPDRWIYWFMMQIAMLFGIGTALPVNAWLIRKGVKEAM